MIMRLIRLLLIAGLALPAPAGAQAWGERTRAMRLAVPVLRSFAGGVAPAAPMRVVTNNTILPTSTTSAGQAEQSTIHTVTCSGGLSDIQLVWPGYTISTAAGEQTLGSNYTAEAAIESGGLNSGTYTRITTGGVNVGTVIAGAGINTRSDVVAVPAPLAAGSTFRLWYRLVGATLPQFTAGGTGKALYSDEGRNTGASTSTPKAVTDNDGGPRRSRTGPIAILGHCADATTVMIVGDSQQADVFSTNNMEANANHCRGDVEMALCGQVGTINAGVGGDQNSSWIGLPHAGVLELAQYASHVVVTKGTNEFNNHGAFTASMALGYALRTAPFFNGTRQTWMTITPRTTGAWTLADGSDQTIPSLYSAGRATYNSGILSAFNGYARGALVQLAGDANKLAANGTTAWCSNDGIHLLRNCQGLIAADASNMLITINAAPVGAFAQPAFALTGGTYSASYLSNGTATGDAQTVASYPASDTIKELIVTSAPASTTAFWQWGANVWNMSLTTSCTLSVRDGSGTTTTPGSPVSLCDGQPHALSLERSGSGFTLYLDGAAHITRSFAFTTNQIAGSVSLIASTTTGLKMRGFASWNALLGGTVPVVTTPSSTPNLFSYFDLQSSGAGQAGPVLAQ